jgi:hypothetical protein
MASFDLGDEFRGLPYNKSLQATPVPASSAFGHSRRYGGALELHRYRAEQSSASLAGGKSPSGQG